MIFPADFDKNRTYYLSGPMTGYPDFNVKSFRQACFFLRELGVSIISPHELPVPDDKIGEDLWRHMMSLCHEQMAKAYGIIFLPGWWESRGACQEFEWAKIMGYKGMFFLDDGRVISMNRRV